MDWIVLATEDEISEEVGIKLAREAGLEIGLCLGKEGNGYLRKRVPNFCQMAVQQPVFVITDLDQLAHPSKLLADWLGSRVKPPKLLIRVAVREIESWLLADHVAVRSLLGTGIGKLPLTPDSLADPKRELLALAQKASRTIRDDLVASRGSISSQGLGYNARLAQWIRQHWEPSRAAERSPSLSRTRVRLKELSALSHNSKT